MAGGGGAGIELELEDIAGKCPLKTNHKVLLSERKNIRIYFKK